METRKCPNVLCPGTMYHSDDMENPFAGTDDHTPFWQCELCGDCQPEYTEAQKRLIAERQQNSRWELATTDEMATTPETEEYSDEQYDKENQD